MKGLTLTMKEQTRLQVLNGVLARLWLAAQGAAILGVSHTLLVLGGRANAGWTLSWRPATTGL